MKRKLLLAILLLIIASQVPFAYRRYRLRKLQIAIQQLSAQQVPADSENQYVDYKGVIHVHSFLGGHSTGTFSELIAAAKANGLDFVIMTEHPQSNFDTSAMTLNGVHDDILFINGNEVVTANNDRLLLIPGASDAATDSTRATQEIVEEQKRNGGLSFVAYPSESESWRSTAATGVEVYNLFTNAREIRPITMFFDGLWSYRSYADLMFANFFSRPAANLQQWDAAMLERKNKSIAIAGNDAHSNIGASLNDGSGKQLIGLKLDPYERSFRVVRTHVLIRKGIGLTRDSLLEALALGHCYISFDIFSNATGFDFSISNSDKTMGDDATVEAQTRLSVRTPVPSRIALLKNGDFIEQRSGTTVEFAINGPGIYRAEVYLDSLPGPVTGQPWIISNPIYLQ
ncbi:MAG TPA: hypothetical protein VE863_08790 [Pyrinomonadaceae bacterium]|nr:hypothetical protein [Pyrinomonadaceae bacterium]